MDVEQQRLSQLAQQMDPVKRRDLQELLANELERRKIVANGGEMDIGTAGARRAKSPQLDRDVMRDIYSSMERPVQELRVKQLEEKLAQAQSLSVKAAKSRSKDKEIGQEPWFANPLAGIGKVGAGLFSNPKVLLFGLIACGVVKIVFTATEGETSVTSTAAVVEVAQLPAIEQKAVEPQATVNPFTNTAWSEGDKALLTDLDERRVELERRSSQLDQRERELNEQSKAVAERIAELRGISNKLAEVRRERDTQQTKRLEQLANVYTSMAPNEAAELISRIDDEIALGLLERMPGKRLGQILGLMKPERAVDLTKRLTDRQQ